jgi:hypothetical protein
MLGLLDGLEDLGCKAFPCSVTPQTQCPHPPHSFLILSELTGHIFIWALKQICILKQMEKIVKVVHQTVQNSCWFVRKESNSTIGYQ